MNLVEVIERHQTDRVLRWCRLQGGEVQEDEELVVTIVGLPVAFTNNALRARLTAENVERRVRETAELFRARGVPAMFWVGPLSTPPELPRVLQANGFRHDEDMPWMARELDEIGEAILPDGVEAYRVDGPERQAQWLVAMMRGFGRDEHVADALTRLADAVGFAEDSEWQRFVAMEGGKPVASAGLMLGGGVAGIYNMATVPEARGRGVGAAMATIAMWWAREHGFRTAILGSQPLAVPLYERLGFRYVCRLGVYVLES